MFVPLKNNPQRTQDKHLETRARFLSHPLASVVALVVLLMLYQSHHFRIKVSPDPGLMQLVIGLEMNINDKEVIRNKCILLSPFDLQGNLKLT